jgi:hypothetical protein
MLVYRLLCDTFPKLAPYLINGAGTQSKCAQILLGFEENRECHGDWWYFPDHIGFAG